jgi:geranylgeranyl reductase family protein
MVRGAAVAIRRRRDGHGKLDLVSEARDTDVGRPYDVVVVGAGPAGSAAALGALRRDPRARVALIDAQSFPRDKSCGDGIAPHCFDELRDLGVTGVQHGYAPVDRLRFRTPSGRDVLALPPRASHVIPRTVFDARLVEAAVDAGATLLKGRVRALAPERDGVTLDIGRGQGPSTLRGRVVIGTDGANSTVRRALGLPGNPPSATAVAMRAYAPATDGIPEQLIHTIGDGWPAYAWSFPIGDGRANIGFGMLRQNLAGRGRTGLTEPLARLLPHQPIEAGSDRAAHLPMSTWRPRQPDGRVLLAGDAASLINPLTGEGIYYAILSGRLAGQSAVGCATDVGADFRATLRRELGWHLATTTLLARLARNPDNFDSAIALAGRDPAALDALVDIGLGRGLLPPPLAGRLLLRLVERLPRYGLSQLLR